MALGIFPEPPARMTRIVLLRDDFVVLARPGHPAGGSLDLDGYLAWPHLLVSPVASREGAVDRALAALGRSRVLAAVVSHHLVVAPILQGSTLLCTMARRLAQPLAAAFGLELLPLPAGLLLAAPADLAGLPQSLRPAARAPLAARPGRRNGAAAA